MTKHLELTQGAIDKIKAHLTDDTRVLLSYDDGVGPYSHHGLVALQVSFQLVLINKDMPYNDYDKELDSNLGTIYFKGYSEKFLGDNMKLTLQPRYNTLVLADDNDEIDENVEIVDERTH